MAPGFASVLKDGQAPSPFFSLQGWGKKRENSKEVVNKFSTGGTIVYGTGRALRELIGD